MTAKLTPVSTPMRTATALDPDENGEVVDTAPDIQFTVCLCVRFQASHAPHIGLPFNKFFGISSTLLSLVFGTLLLFARSWRFFLCVFCGLWD
jgi:hypothetical protein